MPAPLLPASTRLWDEPRDDAGRTGQTRYQPPERPAQGKKPRLGSASEPLAAELDTPSCANRVQGGIVGRLNPLEELARLREELTRGYELPSLLTPAEVAAVTGLAESAIRYRLDVGRLDFVQEARNATRRVPIEVVDKLCERMRLIPDWDALARMHAD